MNPSPFEVGRAIGNNLGTAFRNVQDTSALDQILENANRINDPNAINDAMGQILRRVSPEKQQMAIGILQNKQKEIQQRLDRERTQNEFALQRGGIEKARGLAPGSLNEFGSNIKLAEQVTRPGKGAGSEYGGEYAKIREKAIGEYVNTALVGRDQSEDLKTTIEEARSAINSGQITEPGVTAFLKNNPYTSLLVGLTPEESKLQSANKKFLEGSKGIFGSKPTEREIFLLLNDMLPSIGKTKEANLVSLNFIERINEMKLMHADIVSELTDGGKNYVPDIEQKVNAIMRPYGEKLRKDMEVAREALKEQELNKLSQTSGKKSAKTKSEDAKIKVKAPDGREGYMTQEAIQKAKENNVIFTPV